MSGVTIGVFGATGLTGRRVVGHALDEGHTVRGMARNLTRIGIEHPDLTVVEGDFENIAALQTTVEETTHVICCGGGTYGKGYDKGMMTRFVQRLWPILDAEPSLTAFLFQSVIFARDLDGTIPPLLRATAPRHPPGKNRREGLTLDARRQPETELRVDHLHRPRSLQPRRRPGRVVLRNSPLRRPGEVAEPTPPPPSSRPCTPRSTGCDGRGRTRWRRCGRVGPAW